MSGHKRDYRSRGDDDQHSEELRGADTLALRPRTDLRRES